MYVYDTYVPGTCYGEDRFEITPRLLGDWQAMFPDDDLGDCMPPGMVTPIQQNAYKNVITPRPPGHVQGGQEFELRHLPRLGATLRTEVSCLSKEIRKERRWVRMGFICRDDAGQVVFTAVNTVLVPC